jgi:hypothetical protein
VDTNDFADLLIDPATRVLARDILNDALRHMDERIAKECVDRLAGLRRLANEWERQSREEDDNL